MSKWDFEKNNLTKPEEQLRDELAEAYKRAHGQLYVFQVGFSDGFDAGHASRDAEVAALKHAQLQGYCEKCDEQIILSADRRFEYPSDRWREMCGRMASLLQSLNVQAIINGQPGQQSVTVRINQALKEFEEMKGAL